MSSITATAPATAPHEVELPERATAVVRVTGPAAELPSMIGSAFERTSRAIAASGAAFAGPPFARYFTVGEQIDAEVGFPFVGVLQPTGGVYVSSLPGGRAVTATHVGPYVGLAGAWERVRAWLGEHGLTSSDIPWECYLTGPDEPGPPSTEIVFPVR